MESNKINIKMVSSVVKDIGDLYRHYENDIDKFDEMFKVYIETCEDVELGMLVYQYYQENVIEK